MGLSLSGCGLMDKTNKQTLGGGMSELMNE